MTSLSSFCNYANKILNCKTYNDYGPNGLQVEGSDTVKSFATAVTASLFSIEKAIELKVQLLLVHHGLFWKNDSYEVTGSKQKKLKLLLENNISLIAYHLPLDAHTQLGNNWAAASALGWKNLKPFCFINGMAIGVKGTFSKRSRNTLKKQLEEFYQHPSQVAFGGKPEVSTGAIISGGGYRNIIDAAKDGLDCFITGNYDEPAWHNANEEKINFFALGHAATERIGPRLLGEHLAKHFKLKHQFIEDDNPF